MGDVFVQADHHNSPAAHVLLLAHDPADIVTTTGLEWLGGVLEEAFAALVAVGAIVGGS